MQQLSVQSALIMSETMIANTVPFRWVLWFIKVFRSSSDCNFERFKNNIETTQLLFHNLFNFLGIVLQNIMRPTFRFLKLASNFQQTPTIRSPFKDLAHNVNSYSLSHLHNRERTTSRICKGRDEGGEKLFNKRPSSALTGLISQEGRNAIAEPAFSA